jgi:hypothetical protein
MDIYFLKEKKIPQRLKPTYLSNYLSKMEQKIKQLEDEI